MKTKPEARLRHGGYRLTGGSFQDSSRPPFIRPSPILCELSTRLSRLFVVARKTEKSFGPLATLSSPVNIVALDIALYVAHH